MDEIGAIPIYWYLAVQRREADDPGLRGQPEGRPPYPLADQDRVIASQPGRGTFRGPDAFWRFGGTAGLSERLRSRCSVTRCGGCSRPSRSRSSPSPPASSSCALRRAVRSTASARCRRRRWPTSSAYYNLDQPLIDAVLHLRLAAAAGRSRPVDGLQRFHRQRDAGDRPAVHPDARVFRLHRRHRGRPRRRCACGGQPEQVARLRHRRAGRRRARDPELPDGGAAAARLRRLSRLDAGRWLRQRLDPSPRSCRSPSCRCPMPGASRA